jgi:hypothetical protein
MMMPDQAETLCTDLIVTLKARLTAADFLERHRQSSTDFIRNRCLPFVVVVMFLLNLIKRSLQDELDEFFNLETGAEVAPRKVTKSAFSQARKKLKAEAFIELNTVQVDYFYDHFSYQTWHGYRLLAVDGSTNQLPLTTEIVSHFGLWRSVPMARVSQLFDVLNEITVDALIGPKAMGERDCASRHFDHIGSDDLVLMDRGYPAFWLFALIRRSGSHFCARMPAGVWGVVDQFLASGLSQQIIDLHPCQTARQECLARDLPITPLTLRLVRIDLDQGEVEVLLSSLLDLITYPHAVFKDLYHHRWPVEEDYKVMKPRLEIENWSGKSTLAIYQDFHAKVFTKNLTAILAHPAQQVVKQQSQHKKYTYQINFTQALSKMKDTVVLLFHRTNLANILSCLWQVMTQTIEPIRPGRTYPRTKPIKPRKFPMAYKPIR